MKEILGFIGASLLSLLVGCGGGSAAGSSGLSATQINFESSAIKDTYVGFDWNLPTTNVAPTSGTHYLYTLKYAAPASPSLGSQVRSEVITNLSSTLALPSLTTRGVSRVVKVGAIYATHFGSKATYTYLGNDVVITAYATDGNTALYSSGYDNWSPPITLSGQIGNTVILKSFLGFTRITTQPVNFDFSQSWLAGSTYFTSKAYRKADTLFVYDWPGAATFDSNVTPYGGTETTIENYFHSPGILAAGGMSIAGVTYAILDGEIGTVEGVRTWVATTKLPTSARPTDEYVVLFELSGKLYFGGLQKAGTRLRLIDGVDSTIVNDFNIRLNGTAADSMKQVVKF